MPDIRHFGPGHRRPDPPPGSDRLYPATILREETAAVVELHFEPGGEMPEHDADHPILFVVIAGRGMVRVGGEEAEVAAGQAVVWPAGVPHKAWARGEPLTAISVHHGMARWAGAASPGGAPDVPGGRAVREEPPIAPGAVTREAAPGARDRL